MRNSERFFKLCGTIVIAATAFFGAAAVGIGFSKAVSFPAMNLGEAITYIVSGFAIFLFATGAVHDQIRAGGDRRARERETFAMIENVMRKVPIGM
jgi:hypothetical protein